MAEGSDSGRLNPMRVMASLAVLMLARAGRGHPHRTAVRVTASLAVLMLGLGGLHEAARAETFPLPPEDVGVVGQVRSVRARYEDTLVDLAQRLHVGYEEIRLANPKVDAWLPGEGTPVVVPTRYVLPSAPREGLVLNVPEMRLYYYPRPQAGVMPTVETYPVSIGRMDWKTPLGQTRIESKIENPTWTPPESIRQEHAAEGDILPEQIPPGPDNPLGQHAFRLSIPGYLIHGTNKAAGVGMRVTHGCVRMFPADIASLYARVPVGTPVRIVNQPYKAGWVADMLYLEAHPPLEEDAGHSADGMEPVWQVLLDAQKERPPVQVDGDRVRAILKRLDGIPAPVGGDALQRTGAMMPPPTR